MDHTGVQLHKLYENYGFCGLGSMLIYVVQRMRNVSEASCCRCEETRKQLKQGLIDAIGDQSREKKEKHAGL